MDALFTLAVEAGMSDAQFGVLLAAIATAGGSIAAAIKFAGGRLVRSLDGTSERAIKAQDRGTDALVANTASNATLSAKLTELGSKVDELGDKVDAIGDFVEEHTPPVATVPTITAKTTPITPPKGIRPPRPGTHHDD